jgi:hypothetical protein
LSVKQFAILARTVVENCGALDDCDGIRAKLQQFVPGGFSPKAFDPSIDAIFKLLESVTEWNPRVRRGRKVYDDRNFYESLKSQHSQKGSLSELQINALKKLAYSYRSKIAGYEEAAVALGLKNSSPNPENPMVAKSEEK